MADTLMLPRLHLAFTTLIPHVHMAVSLCALTCSSLARCRLALRGLAHSARRTLGGASVNPAFMTWDPPAGIIGSEPALIALLPVLAESLCSDASMLAFGHNDIVTDNAYFWREPTRGRATGRAASGATFGLFDWQQVRLART
mgnify:CR=1 FL=1